MHGQANLSVVTNFAVAENVATEKANMEKLGTICRIFLKIFVDMGFSLPRTQPLQRQIITIPRLVKPRRLQPSKSHTFNSHHCKLARSM